MLEDKFSAVLDRGLLKLPDGGSVKPKLTKRRHGGMMLSEFHFFYQGGAYYGAAYDDITKVTCRKLKST
jgi:hypothetical protein